MKNFNKEDLRRAWEISEAGHLAYNNFEDYYEQVYGEVEDHEGDVQQERGKIEIKRVKSLNVD